MTFALFYLTVVFSTLAMASWDINAVSYLMPLPENEVSNGLLTSKHSGAKGPLLPALALRQLPHLTSVGTQDPSTQSLSVVSLRLDPCFPKPVPEQCQAQVRMIWQPLKPDFSGGMLSIDASLHSFYDLTLDEFRSLLADIQKWKKHFSVSTTGLPLQRHPAWRNTTDPSLQEFQKIILRYTGEANLTRITAMALRRAGDVWHFTGIEVPTPGQYEKMRIPRLNAAKAQNFANISFPMTSFRGGYAPKPEGTDTFKEIPADSSQLGEDVIRTEIGVAYKIENPHFYNPENMDCVSCHIAQPMIQWALKQHPGLRLDQHWSSSIYKNSRYNMTNVTPDIANTHNVRAFGYFGSQIAISQRTINESAQVADVLNGWLEK